MSSLFDYLKKLNIPYKDEKLYITATTHASMNNLTNAESYSDYSSLSIIGTQILNATNMKILYEKNYKLKHKDLLNENRSFVIQDNIGKIAEQEGIVNFIRINDSLKNDLPYTVLGDSLCAIIGAIYLDVGINYAENVTKYLITKYHKMKVDYIDYKSKLQEYVQNYVKKDPNGIKYDMRMSGPANNATIFVTLKVKNKIVSSASGTSRKKAEAEAARIALTTNKDILDRILK